MGQWVSGSVVTSHKTIYDHHDYYIQLEFETALSEINYSWLWALYSQKAEGRTCTWVLACFWGQSRSSRTKWLWSIFQLFFRVTVIVFSNLHLLLWPDHPHGLCLQGSASHCSRLKGLSWSDPNLPNHKPPWCRFGSQFGQMWFFAFGHILSHNLSFTSTSRRFIQIIRITVPNHLPHHHIVDPKKDYHNKKLN